MNIQQTIRKVLREEATDTEYAVIEIIKPSSRMPRKWYFQAVPFHKTQQDKIYIKRGPAGTLTISTDNIKIHKKFKESEKEEMDKYLEKLRDEDKKIKESVIKEETSELIRLLRRLHNVDELLELKLRIHFTPKDLCRNKSHEEFLRGVSYSVIDTMYWDYFGDVDDNSEEWISMVIVMEKYIQDKYGEQLKKYYQKHCSEKVETNESELTEKCWKGYTQKGMKTMFGKRYPNCVKKTKSLKEESEEEKDVNSLIEKYVEKYYTIDYNFSRAETLRRRVFRINISLIPKKSVSLEKSELPIFYSTWIVEYGTLTCYDTNSAYVENTIFKKVGLQKELESWLYQKSKEFAKTLQ